MADRIVSMPRASVSPDGQTIELDFETQTGDHRVFQFGADDFDRFISRAAQLVLGARTRTPTTPGHLEAHALEAVDIGAQASVGAGTVILMLRGSSGIPMAISLSPELAEQLRPQLFRAAKAARREKEKARH